MKLSTQSHSSIVHAVKKALARYEKGTLMVTDIHFQPVLESGELVIWNDDEEELGRVVVQEWVNCNAEDFHASIESVLKNVLIPLNEEGFFHKLVIMKPYSIVLVDDEKETLSDLLLIDDDAVLVSDELLKGLDEELNAFLKDLLER